MQKIVLFCYLLGLLSASTTAKIIEKNGQFVFDNEVAYIEFQLSSDSHDLQLQSKNAVVALWDSDGFLLAQTFQTNDVLSISYLMAGDYQLTLFLEKNNYINAANIDDGFVLDSRFPNKLTDLGLKGSWSLTIDLDTTTNNINLDNTRKPLAQKKDFSPEVVKDNQLFIYLLLLFLLFVFIWFVRRKIK